MLLQTWWIWGVAALVLAIIEVVLPSYIFLGFAIGAGLVALLILIDGWLTVGPYGLTTLLVIFAIASLFAWIALRNLFRPPSNNVKIWRKDINDN